MTGDKTTDRVLYCITPALDRYIMLLDMTTHTWMMTSLNICCMAFHDHWHPHLHLSLFYLCPSILLLSGLLPSELITCRQNTPSADPHEAWLLSVALATFA